MIEDPKDRKIAVAEAKESFEGFNQGIRADDAGSRENHRQAAKIGRHFEATGGEAAVYASGAGRRRRALPRLTQASHGKNSLAGRTGRMRTVMNEHAPPRRKGRRPRGGPSAKRRRGLIAIDQQTDSISDPSRSGNQIGLDCLKSGFVLNPLDNRFRDLLKMSNLQESTETAKHG
jgi:hypothetical protein